MAPFVDDWLANLDRALHHRFKQDRLAVELDIAGCDSREIEHVIHQKH